MSVNIKFEPDGQVGIVAEGTYLWDAAKRLGVVLPAECAGRGTCDTCAVIVEDGLLLLSSLTEAERQHLSAERIGAGERLACQVKIERGGDIVVRPVPVAEREETTAEAVKDMRQEFRKMPLQKKLATLVELEAVTAYQTFNAIANLPSFIGEKVLDLMAGRGRILAKRQREAHRPTEHQRSTGEESVPGVTVTKRPSA